MPLNDFKSIALNAEGKRKVDLIHTKFQDLLDELEKLCFRDENFASAKYNLKCAAFMAVRSMCMKKENQDG